MLERVRRDFLKLSQFFFWGKENYSRKITYARGINQKFILRNLLEIKFSFENFPCDNRDARRSEKFWALSLSISAPLPEVSCGVWGVHSSLMSCQNYIEMKSLSFIERLIFITQKIMWKWRSCWVNDLERYRIWNTVYNQLLRRCSIAFVPLTCKIA